MLTYGEAKQVKELERLNNIVQDRENTEGSRSKEIRKLREEIEGLSKTLGRYPHLCSPMLTYAHLCSRMLTHAHVC